MIRNLFIFLFLIGLSSTAFSQDEPLEEIVVDSLYREDQFYVGLTFHLLSDLPKDLSQSGFSGGFHLGFIRDWPINKRRNIAIGTGLGWSINSYGQELFIGEEESGNTIFKNLNNAEIEYNNNSFSTQLIEAPIEFRWRTSTPTSYKFWRVYTGVRLGYIYNFRSSFRQDNNNVVQTDVPELQRFRLGTTFTFGYNTFNLNVYYSLNPFFKNAFVQDEQVGITTFKLGLMFYIL